MNKLQFPPREFASPLPETEVWRPIHYLGSKLRLVELLRLAIDRVDPSGSALCDLFAGSGTVSAAFAPSRDVVTVDIQEYSSVLCSAVLRPVHICDANVKNFIDEAFGAAFAEQIESASPLIEYEEQCLLNARRSEPTPLCELIDHASIVAFRCTPSPVGGPLAEAHNRTLQRLRIAGKDSAAETLMFRYFGGLYFSYLQAVQLDALLTAAHRRNGDLRNTLLAATISTASEIVNTVGKHFAQPIRPHDSHGRPKKHLIGKIIRDRQLDVSATFVEWLNRYRSLRPTGRAHRIMRADFAEALAILGKKIGVVYADPPYTREHYSRFYHVLETMCLWDDPGVSTTRIRVEREKFSRGMYRADRHQSPFCIRSQAPGAFERLFAGVRDIGAPLVLSYSPYAADKSAHPRVMTVEKLGEIAGKFFRLIEITSAGHISHSKLNATRLNLDASSEAELIFLCT